MSDTARAFLNGLKGDIDGMARRVGIRRATVSTTGSGLVTVQELGADAANSEASARVAGFTLSAADEVVVADIGGRPVVLGKLQRTAPTAYALDAGLAVTGTLGATDTVTASRATGTGLAVTANATVGGTLGVTGATTANGLVSITADLNPAIRVQNAAGTNAFVVDTVNSRVEVRNGASLKLYSDNGVTVTGTMNAATGAADFSGNLTCYGAQQVTYRAARIASATAFSATTLTSILATLAYALPAGTVIRAVLYGNWVSTSALTLTASLRQGTTVVASTSGATLTTTTASGSYWFAEFEVELLTTTSATSVAGFRYINDQNASKNVSNHRMNLNTATTIASASTAWDLTLQWSGIGGQTANVQGGYIKFG